MKFQKIGRSEYEAIGENGSYLIWREGYFWKARYWSNADEHGRHNVHYLLPMRRKFKEIVNVCKNDRNWEKGKKNK